MTFTDKELDAILNEATEALNKAEKQAKLSKSKKLKKDDGFEGEEAPAMDAAPASEEAPAMDAAPGEAEAPIADEGAAPAQDEGALTEESEDAPLTDEELSQIYSSMEPEELERHFMVIRDVLSQSYGDEGGEAPGQEAPMGDEGEEAPAPAMDEAPMEEDAFKSEVALENAKLKKALAQVTVAMTKAFAPQRKAVDTVASMKKSEQSFGQSLSKADISAKLNTITRSPSLTKSERDTINAYVVSGGQVNQKEVVEIINSKGGK